MSKIVQTAGRNALGEFAPEFAHFNDELGYDVELVYKKKPQLQKEIYQGRGLYDAKKK